MRSGANDSAAALEMIAKRRLAHRISDNDGKRPPVHVNQIAKQGRTRVAYISVGNSHFKNPANAIAAEISKSLTPTAPIDPGTVSGEGRAGTVIRAWPVSETDRAIRVRCYGRMVWLPKSQAGWREPGRLWVSALHLNRSRPLRELIARGARVKIACM